MADDPVKAYLDTLNTSNVVRKAAWDAVYDATDSDDLVRRLAKVPFGDQVRSQLWELKFGSGVAESPQQETPAQTPSAAGRFLSNAGAVINPVSMVKGVWNALPIPQAIGGSGVIEGPLNAAKGIYEASADQLSKAKSELGQGHIPEAVGHTFGAIPLVGPAAAAAGEQIASGDVAGGLGTGAGLLLTAGAPAIARNLPRSIPIPAGMKASMKAGAAERVVDVMAPKVGPNKLRFGRMAEKVAPELLERGDIKGFSREALAEHIGQKLIQAEEGLDEAANARLAGRQFSTQPLIAELKAKRAQLTAKAVEGSGGADVVPGPNAERVGVIDQAIKEIQALGPTTTYDPIKLIRQSYDIPAKAVYSPSMTTDYLKAQGGKLGAADVTGVLRENLSKWDPRTAAANADYALYRTANDVLEATAEVERTRPKVGRALIARMIFSGIGMKAGGVAGATTGFVLGPMLESMVGSGPTSKLQTAKLMTKLAGAIRRGDEGHVASIVSQVKQQAAPEKATPKALTRGRGESVLPSSGQVFAMPGEVQTPNPPMVRGVKAAPLGYKIDADVPVKAGGLTITQFSGDPEAVRAAIATPEVRAMLERMADDLDTFEPVRGQMISDPSGARRDPLSNRPNHPGGGHYVEGYSGSGVGTDIRVISQQDVGNPKIKKAIQDLLAGKLPTNRLHTAALDAAMNYLKKTEGYNLPKVPARQSLADLGQLELTQEQLEMLARERASD